MSTFGQILRLFTNKNDSKKLSSVYHVHQTPLTLDLNKQAVVPIVKKIQYGKSCQDLKYFIHLFSFFHYTQQHTISLFAIGKCPIVFFLQRNYFGFKFLMESTSLPTRIIAAICNLNLLNLNVHSLWYELG
jgi:hypothetical protein